MKSQILVIAILLFVSLSCSVASANVFNVNKDDSLPRLRGRVPKQRARAKRNEKLAKKKLKQQGGDPRGEVQGGRKKKPSKKNQGKNNAKQQSRPNNKKPANKKNNPDRKNETNKKEKPNKSKPGKEKIMGKKKPGKKAEPQQTIKPNGRIIGGSQATPNRNKFVVSLQDHMGHFCGGSLIAKNVVLSAAHCQGGPYDVVLGRHDLDTNNGQKIKMARELPHPDYRESNTDNDFMLVFLSSAATLNNEVDLIAINDDSSSPGVGSAVTVMGWGDTNIRDDVSTLSDVLMKVQVNVISNNDCDDSSGTIGGYSDNYHGQITQNMLCARANKQDSCQGDSGGPLIQGNTQVGVVSWGIGCASDDFPGVYARVSRAHDWIEQEVCNKSPEYGTEAGFDCSGAGTSSAQSPSPPSGSYNNPAPPPSSDGGGPNYNPAPSPSGNWSPSGGGGGNIPDNGDDWYDDFGGDDNWDDDWNFSNGGGSGSNYDDYSLYNGDGYGDDDYSYGDDDYSNGDDGYSFGDDDYSNDDDDYSYDDDGTSYGWDDGW